MEHGSEFQVRKFASLQSLQGLAVPKQEYFMPFNVCWGSISAVDTVPCSV